MAMVRARARITGRVQGVSFRYHTMEEAERLGVVGWVRNEADGSVLVEAGGTEASVGELLAWCRHGPPGARVEDVTIEWIAPLQGETSFRIARRTPHGS